MHAPSEILDRDEAPASGIEQDRSTPVDDEEAAELEVPVPPETDLGIRAGQPRGPLGPENRDSRRQWRSGFVADGDGDGGSGSGGDDGDSGGDDGDGSDDGDDAAGHDADDDGEDSGYASDDSSDSRGSAADSSSANSDVDNSDDGQSGLIGVGGIQGLSPVSAADEEGLVGNWGGKD